jgi:hypothetical protein
MVLMRRYVFLTAIFLCGISVSALSEGLDVIPFVSGDGTPDGRENSLFVPLAYEIRPRISAYDGNAGYVYLSHDGERLLVIIHAPDDEPHRIRGSHSLRDGIDSRDDRILLAIDPDADGRRAYEFTVNPRGSKADRIRSSFGMAAPNWRADWEASAEINEAGYVVQFEIPFSILGIREEQIIALNVSRVFGRGRREQVSTDALDARSPCIECEYSKYRINSISDSGPENRVIPYITVGSMRSRSPGGKGFERDADSRIGADISRRSAAGSNLWITLNPDFSQVEIDTIHFQINRRTPRMFPERRPFFTENAGVFSTPNPLLHSRILFDPDYGFQYTKERSGSTFGALLSDDSLTFLILPFNEGAVSVSEAIPSSNGVFRSTSMKDWGSIGGFVSARRARGYDSDLISVDGSYTGLDNHRFIWQAAYSSASSDDSWTRLSPHESDHAYWLRHTYGRGKYFGSTAYSEIGEEFRADLGFFSRRGVRRFAHSSSLHIPVEDNDSPLSSMGIGLSLDRLTDLDNLELQRDVTLSSHLQFANEFTLDLFVDHTKERFMEQEFRLLGGQVNINSSISDNLSVNVTHARSDAVDFAHVEKGTEVGYYTTLTYNKDPSLRLSTAISKIYLYVDEGRSFGATDINSRVRISLTPRQHLSLAVGYGWLDLFEDAEVFSERIFNGQVTYRFETSAYTNFILGASFSGGSGEEFIGHEVTQSFVFGKVSVALGG